MSQHYRPSLLSRLVRRLLVFLHRLRPIAVSGGVPVRRGILVGAPHTSNWDFIYFIGATHDLGIRPRFMGKHSLFRWPMKRFMYDMGGVPVNRSASGNYVDTMVDAFAAHPDDFLVVIAPEGTRGSIRGWKSGFYHIAVGARVPIVLAWIDYGTGKGGFSEPMDMTGDFAADMARIAAFYRSVMPDHPKLAVLYREHGGPDG